MSLAAGTLSNATQGRVYVRFNESAPEPVTIRSASSLVFVCPEVTRPGSVSVSIFVADDRGAVVQTLAWFAFSYVWPTTEVSPATISANGGNIALTVWARLLVYTVASMFLF